MARAHDDDRDQRRGAWRSMDLIHDGRRFLARRGLDLRLFGVYLHRIDAPDPGRDLHDHPWPFVSIVLRGAYTEEWDDTRTAVQRGAHMARTWTARSVHFMPLHVCHRIAAVDPGTMTLVIRGPRGRTWGFYQPGIGWVSEFEYDYLGRRGGTVEA